MRVLTSMPNPFAELQSDPGLIPAFVEEVLRYDGPVQALPRGTTRPTTIAGVTIPADSSVLVYFGSANRDERHFPDPDRFQVERIQQITLDSGAASISASELPWLD